MSARRAKEPAAGASAARPVNETKKGGDLLPPFTRTLRCAVGTSSPAAARAEALVVYAFEGARSVEGLPAGRLRKELDAVLLDEGFRAKRGRTLLYHTSGRHPARRVVVAGLGRKDDADLDALRTASASAARRAAAAAVRTLTFAPPPEAGFEGRSAEERVRAVAEGFLLGSYRFRKYFTGEERTEEGSLRGAEILVPARQAAAARRGARRAAIGCSAANLARDIVNEPAIALTPIRLAEIAEGLARRAGIECRVHDEKEIEALGMNAFLGVARGSHQPPRLVHLTYRPQGKPARRIALVGKGLTFDSGGLSLKPASSMETMKLDKAGAVAVMASILALAETRPPVEVHALMGMTENMPGGSAIKPGDVLRSSGGKTIEVLNTDAEGRLVLADLLCYAGSLGVDEVIDLATLTGACVVALGPLAAGLFGTDPPMIDRLLGAAERAGEKMWPMPMYEEYRDQIRSDVADVKNTGDKYGGAITAALFLREFAGRRTPWIHLDIAGPAFMESTSHPYMGKGATGAGVRTLIDYISSFADAP